MLATAILLFIERRTSNPMLPLELFSSTTFSAANVVGLLLNFGFYGQLFFINLFFQQVKGYSPLLTGLALLPETGMVWLGKRNPGMDTLLRGTSRDGTGSHKRTLAVALEAGNGIKTTAVEIAFSGYPYDGHLLPVFPA